MNDGSNDDDDNNDNNDDGDEAIWESLDSDAAVVLLCVGCELELELELIQTQMTQKPMLRAEAGMRVRCANKASARWFMRRRGIGQNSRKNCKNRGICG